MKSLAGHQTYLFPYIGYFTVLYASDIFIYADCLQYEKKSWMNRNRIISEDGSIRYFIVPVRKAAICTPTNEKAISFEMDWENSILNQLGYYKKRAPYYNNVVELLKEVFEKKYDNISELAIASIEHSLKFLGIEKKTYRLSELISDPPKDLAPDEWGIYTCKMFESEGVDTFINAPLGKTFYDAEKYRKNGLNLAFIQNNQRPYDQGLEQFADSLSIIDVLMFNSPEEVRDMLIDYIVI